MRARWVVALVLAAAPMAALAGAQQAPAPDLSWVAKEFKIVGARSIPSEHMLPTLLVGDRLSLVEIKEPRRGDIVVFRHPHAARDAIQRIVGLPGDTVEMRGGRLVLNGKEIARTLVRQIKYVPDSYGAPAFIRSATEYSEQLPGEDKPHLIHEWGDTMDLDETPVFKVPAGHLFMMGDNRDNSEDSRAPSGHRDLVKQFPNAWTYRGTGLPEDTRDDAIGFVPVANLIGRVATVTASTSTCKLSDEFKAQGAVCLTPNIGKRL